MNIKVLGFRAYIESVDLTLAKINDIVQDGDIIQLLNADAVAGKNHIFHGVNQACLAFKRGENLANDFGVEVILRCSAQRQISKAFNILGLNEGNMNICAVLINCQHDYADALSQFFVLDDSVLIADDNNLIEIYGIENYNISIEESIIDKVSRLVVDY